MENKRVTPKKITSLKENEWFVFGSNTEGRHGAGAAKVAKDKFGAIYGQSKGLQGQSYAIITKDLSKGERSVSLDFIKEQVKELKDFVTDNPHLTFYVTEIGCNLAGFEVEEIAPFFFYFKNISNVYLPESFIEVNKTVLPRVNAEGKPRISYSQLKSWKSKTAFKPFEDKVLSGASGYILQYFLGYEHPWSNWDLYSEFGLKVEKYICEKVVDDLDEDEIRILDTIKPIGVFQEEVNVDFGDFVLTGYIDDCNEDRSILRDYKSASLSSAKQYSTNDYTQLDIYSLERYKETGLIPKLEVVVIERKGYHKKPPLKVSGTFTIPRTTNAQRLLQVELEVIETVKEISDCYKLFLEINK